MKSLRIRDTKLLLPECDILFDMNAEIWKAEEFSGNPFFYPVFNYGNLYSYNPAFLILQKKHLTPNYAHINSRTRHMDHAACESSIDVEIQRIGGSLQHLPLLATTDDVAIAAAQAMQADLTWAEDKLPNFANAVLCGGTDSLNLLLLKWQRLPVVYSAQPNLPLVAEFVKANKLALQVKELSPVDPPVYDQEILFNCCQVNLSNFKWTTHLSTIAREYDHKITFWKGQSADAIFTDYWKRLFVRKGYASNKINRRIRPALLGLKSKLWPGRRYSQQEVFLNQLWNRVAAMQGFHMGFLRAICKVPVLSGYHGPHMAKVIASIDYASAITDDIRPRIGELIYGRKVIYPVSNPSPPPRNIPPAVSSYASFKNILLKNQIHIRE